MKALIIHGFEGSSKDNWFPWLELELIERGYEVFNEDFPNSAHPDVEEILGFYEPQMTGADLVIGHSLGALLALKLAEVHEFDRLIMVAPTIGALDFEHLAALWPKSDVAALKTLIEGGFDESKIKVREKIAIFSDDDPYVPYPLIENLSEEWTKVTLKGKGHMQKSPFSELLEWI